MLISGRSSESPVVDAAGKVECGEWIVSGNPVLDRQHHYGRIRMLDNERLIADTEVGSIIAGRTPD